MNGAEFSGDWRAWSSDPAVVWKEADFTGAPSPPEGEEMVSDERVCAYLRVDTSMLLLRFRDWKIPRESRGRWLLSRVEIWRRTNDPYRNHLR